MQGGDSKVLFFFCSNFPCMNFFGGEGGGEGAKVRKVIV